MSYQQLRIVLIVAITISLSFTLTGEIGLFGGVTTVALFGAMSALIYVRRGELVNIYQTRVSRASQQRPTDSLIWRVKPRVIDFASGFVVCGPLLVAMAYHEALYPRRPTRAILSMAYDVFGPVSMVMMYCFLGVSATVFGIEVIVGHRLQKAQDQEDGQAKEHFDILSALLATREDATLVLPPVEEIRSAISNLGARYKVESDCAASLYELGLSPPIISQGLFSTAIRLIELSRRSDELALR